MMDELVGFMFVMLFGIGIVFELLVVMVVLGWIGFVIVKMLWKFDKYVFILLVVVGGVLMFGFDVLF